MSGDEKAAQIGEAMLTLEQQKRDLAHLGAKIEKVRLAYRTFGSERERWQVDASNSARVFLARPSSEERDLAAYLLGQSDLAALIMEHKAAEDALRQTKATLAGFGITSS